MRAALAKPQASSSGPHTRIRWPHQITEWGLGAPHPPHSNGVSLVYAQILSTHFVLLTGGPLDP